MMITNRPLLLPFISLAAGCMLQYLLDVPVVMLVPVIFLCLMACLLPARSAWLYGFAVALFWTGWGLWALTRYDLDSSPSFIRTLDMVPVVVEGVINSRPVHLQDGQRLDLLVEQIQAPTQAYRWSGRLLVTIAGGQGDWLTGDRIRFPARIKLPRLLGLPGEFNYPRYLALHGYQATAWVREAGSVVLMQGNAVWSLQRVLDTLAGHCRAMIRQVIPQPDLHGVLIALATGSQHEIPDPLQTAYTRAGVNHILSVSGFHVGIVTAVWVYLLRWLLLRCEWLALRVDLKRAALLSALPIMIAYLLFTGSAWATARAVLMLAVIVLAFWFERDVDGVDALLAAAFLLVLFDPGALFDLSFQLSCVALWGLMVLTPVFMRPFEHFGWTGWRQTLLTVSAASAAATLATLVPVLMAFHQASISGMAANLLVVPILGYGATVLATAAIPIMLAAPWAAAMVLKPAAWLIGLSNQLVSWVAQFPVIQSYAIQPLDFAGMLVVLGSISFIRVGRLRHAVIGGVLLGLCLFHLAGGFRHDGRLHLHLLSVGQAESILITLPDGRTMLIDGGGYLQASTRDFGERYLVPALHRLGVKRVDIMVLTHPHPDHLGGLPAVAEQFQVGEFWQGRAGGQDGAYQRLIQALERQKAVIRTLKANEQPLDQGALQVSVCSVPAAADRYQDVNEASMVLRLNYHDFSALLMADAGVEVEQELIRQGINPVTLLKVGHHGSKTATSPPFLAALQPQLALISAGANNYFKLPAPEVVARIEQQGIRLYRTDQQGTIRVSTDGTSWSVSTYTARDRTLASLRCFFLTGSGCWDNN